MAFCCEGILAEAVSRNWLKPQPKHVCWQFPIYLGPDRGTLRGAIHARMRQTDRLDDSTITCKCGDSCTYPPDYLLAPFLDEHAGCYGH